MVSSFNFDKEYQKALQNLKGSGKTQVNATVLPLKFNVPKIPAFSGTELTQKDFKAPTSKKKKSVPKSKKQNNEPWWLEPLYALQGIGGIVTNQIADWTDGKLDKHDIPLYDTVTNIIKGQKKAWTDGHLDTKDIPLYGGLVEAGKKAKTTEDIFTNLGWKEKPYDPKKGWNFFDYRKGNLDFGDILEFIGDVALDPTTYLTFGGSSALKAGGKAMMNTAKQVAKREGVKLIKGSAEEIAKHVVSQVEKNYLNKWMKNPLADPYLIQDLAKERGRSVYNEIINAGKAARNQAQNALVNIDVPFTNITKHIGKKPKKLQIRDAKIGENGKIVVEKKLGELGLDKAQQTQLLKSVYGVSDPAHMTTQMLEHFNQVTSGLKKLEPEDFATVFSRAPGFVKDVAPAKGKQAIANWLAPRVEEVFGIKADPAYMAKKNKVKDLKDLANQITHNVYGVELLTPIKLDPYAKSVVSTSVRHPDILKAVETELKAKPFVQDMGGRSELGRKLLDNSPLKYFNPRTLGSKDELVNEAANWIKDAENAIRSNYAKMSRDIARIRQMADGLTESDLAKIPYIIEGKAPYGQTMEQFLADVSSKRKVMRVANEIKGLFDNMAKREMATGSLKNPIEGYFPHVLANKQLSEEQQKIWEQIINDPEIQKWLGRNARNRFNMQRKSFATFADWDNAIHELEQAKQTITDPEELASLDKKLEQLKSLFERDTLKALSERYRTHIRKTAMSQLYRTFEKNGFIVDGEKISEKQLKDYVRIDADLSKKLGIPEGKYIHKEVLEGLKRVESLFTDTGIQKAVETLTSVTNVWKALVTTYIPSHHFFNFVGNIANNMLAGVGISAYKKSAELLTKMRNGTLNDAEKKFIQEAYDNGILASGNTVDAADPLRLAKFNPQDETSKIRQLIQKAEDKAVNNVYARKMRGVGDIIDDFARLAHYIQIRKRTGSAKLAAESVRKYLYNYGELTNADKIIKLIAPFWTWTKNNLPRHLIEFLRQPRYYQAYVRLQQMFQDDQPTDLNPPFLKDYFKVPGTKTTYYNPRLPLTDLGMLDDVNSSILNMLAPELKMPFELKFNRQVFNNAPIDPTKTETNSYDPQALAQYFLRQTGIGNKAVDFYDSKGNLLDDIRNLLIGKPYTVDLDKQKKIQAYLQREEQRAEKRRKANN